MPDAIVEFDMGTFSPDAQPVRLRLMQAAVAGGGQATAKVRATKRLSWPSSVLTDADIGELVMLELTRSSGASSARCAATCKAFAMLLARASQSLLDQGIAYWTGNLPPLKPPFLVGVIGTAKAHWEETRASNACIAKLCPGADVRDAWPFLDNTWCTNFSINLALKASGIPPEVIIADGAHVIQGPRLLNCVLRTQVEHEGGPVAFAHATPIRLPSWTAQLQAAPYVVCALNSCNNHWAALRVWQHGDAEVFDSLPGATSEEQAQTIIDVLACFGWASVKQIHFYSYAHFIQSDSNSCGPLTTAAVVSLYHGHQLGVAYADIALWKAFFAHTIYCVCFGDRQLGFLDV